MSAAAMPFKSRVERFLVERHGLGFSARSEACTLRSFARHLHEIGHCGPLTIEVMTDWARRDSHGSTDPVTWARRLKRLRTFVRWLQQFEPDTEVPDDTVFGRMPERKAPHIPAAWRHFRCPRWPGACWDHEPSGFAPCRTMAARCSVPCAGLRSGADPGCSVTCPGLRHTLQPLLVPRGFTVRGARLRWGRMAGIAPLALPMLLITSGVLSAMLRS